MTSRTQFLRIAALLLIILSFPGAAIPHVQAASSYINPLPLTDGTTRFESCPDPAVIRGQTAGDTDWYLYCTTDPPTGTSQSAARFNGIPRSQFDFRFIPIFRSHDLVNWSYAGDLFAARPAWIALTGYAWAPEVQYFNNQYYLYYTGSETTLPGGGSAIFVATSTSPTGPWTATGTPVVPPQDLGGGQYRWIYDPAVVTDTGGQRYLFFGSYFGGISARKLSTDGLSTDAASETAIAIPNRYEGSAVVHRGNYWYLFASATNCCNGPLTGYSVFVGRSTNLLGPYTDRSGTSFLAGRVGGDPVLSMNGNRWVGTGHNAIFTDLAGQDWMLYHAVDRNDPYFATAPGFTKRPALLDPLDWFDGWPTVRGSLWASDSAQPGPVAQPGERATYQPRHQSSGDALGNLVPQASDDFAPAASLNPQWQWVRPPASGTYGLTDGTLRFATQNAELNQGTNTASVLTEAVPATEYTVETRVHLDLPPDGCCYNYVQAGLVIYHDDDNYIKLTHVAIYETRQIEFAKELFPVPTNYPRYGNTVLGPPTDWTYLRIAKRIRGGEEQYTAYASRDGLQWTQGGTWTHALGSTARIGLVAFGGAGYTANFDYVHVYSTAPIAPQPTRHPDAPVIPPHANTPPPMTTTVTTTVTTPAPTRTPTPRATPASTTTIAPQPPRH